MQDGFIKVAAGTPEIRVADCAYNAQACLSLLHQAAAEGVKVLCLPELCLTGYTVGDLVQHELLQRRAWEAMLRLCRQTEDMAVVVGLPFSDSGRLYNCAAVLQGIILFFILGCEFFVRYTVVPRGKGGCRNAA